MNPAQIKALQKHVGTTADGFWGPKSTAASQLHLRSLMPTPSPWPKADQASLTDFYGKPGDSAQHTRIVPPFPMRYGAATISAITVHRRCAESLLRVLNDILARHGSNPAIMAKASDYYGVYNNRSMRGGSLPSLHARAAAIDMDADTNGNDAHWPVSADMPIEIMECFAREGWLAAGAFWSRDAMHFQATQ
jgi:hypothetical protein